MGKITRKELSDELNNELDSYSTKNELQTLDNKVMSHLAEFMRITQGEDISLDIAKQEKQLRNTNNIIRVATFNIGNFDTGGFDVAVLARRYLTELACDVVGLQEIWNGVIKNVKQLQNEFFLDSYFGKSFLYADKGHNMGNAFISSNSLINSQTVLFNMLNPNLEQRSYSKTSISINSKTINIYNTHLTHDSIDEVVNQLSELYNAVLADSNPYKIIVGDFNTDNWSLFEEFVNDGYIICNTNLPSYKDNGTAIDNIIISPSLTLEYIGIYETDNNVSDHNIIYADVKVV